MAPAPSTFSGASGDLEKLEQQAAERIFQLEDPVNYVLYLGSIGRRAESLAAAAPNLQPSGTPAYRADAFALWANRTRITGDPALAIARARLAVAIDPHVSAPRSEIITSAIMLGQDEQALQQARTVAEGHDWFDPVWSDSNGVAAVVERSTITRDELSGDFARAVSDPCIFCRGCETSAQSWNAPKMPRACMTWAVRATVSMKRSCEKPRRRCRPSRRRWPAPDISWMPVCLTGAAPPTTHAPWPSRLQPESQRSAAIRAKTQAAPLLAIALARSGDLAGAEATIGPTPLDCYGCLRARALIAASAKQPQRADDWFSRAVKAGPSIPFAYAEWGQDLLERGQPDAAIEKFRLANEKGPHFADPLEGWGEALMAKNQSHLALEKFAEAEKYAPNWGRLHLKWGEALVYSGKKDEAQNNSPAPPRSISRLPKNWNWQG